MKFLRYVAPVALLVAASAAYGQRAVSIGYLGNSSPALEAELVDAFRDSLRQLGYVEGRNLVINYRWAEGQEKGYAIAARELVLLKPDVILTAGTTGTLAAKQATPSIPIVAAGVGDAVAAGLVSSLAKPGGNVTGISTLAPDLERKRVELFKQAVPNLSRVAVLLNPANPYTGVAWKAIEPTASRLGLLLQRVEVRNRDELERALLTIGQAKPDGLIVIPDRILLAYRASIVKFVTTSRLPGMFPFREFAQDGGLMAYAPDYKGIFRRAATYVDKIVKGGRPADLPVEQPTDFELLINLKAAKGLGLVIPPALLLRADRIAE